MLDKDAYEIGACGFPVPIAAPNDYGADGKRRGSRSLARQAPWKDVTTQDNDGSTLLHLHLAGRTEPWTPHASVLIQQGVDVTTQNNDGSAPWHLAAQTGGMNLAYLLVGHGADVTTKEDDGWTPLHW
jgi:ankyrin repeat protein